MQCSVTCGTGVQTRTVMCMNDQNVVVSESLCLQANLVRPVEEVSCFLDPCETVATFRYITGSFGQVRQDCFVLLSGAYKVLRHKLF